MAHNPKLSAHLVLQILQFLLFLEISSHHFRMGISGLVVEYIVAIDVTRV